MSEEKYANFEIGGLLRCCIESIPAEEVTYKILAGKEGEYRPCKYCKGAEGGVRFVKGRWIAAWIKE